MSRSLMVEKKLNRSLVAFDGEFPPLVTEAPFPLSATDAVRLDRSNRHSLEESPRRISGGRGRKDSSWANSTLGEIKKKYMYTERALDGQENDVHFLLGTPNRP